MARPRYMLQRNGIWYFSKMVRGKSRRISTKTTDLKAAIKIAERLAVNVEDERWRPHVPTVAEWWEVYQRTYTVKKRAPRRDREIMAHALPVFQNRRMSAVTRSDCERYLIDRRTKAVVDTVTRERAFLQAFWQRAIEEGYEMANPWRGIKRRPFSVRTRVLSLAEEAALMPVCSDAFRGWLRFMLGTGLRLEECRGITPASFNGTGVTLRERIASATTVHVMGKGGKERDVPLLGASRAAALARFDAEGAFWPARQSYWRKELTRYVKKAGIAHVHPHVLRHTFATRYLSGGGDIYILSKILGHSSVTMTEKVYAHLLKEDLYQRSQHVQLGGVVTADSDTQSAA